MQMRNKIVTRGFALTTRHRIVTKGYLTAYEKLIRVVNHGRSAMKHLYDHIDEFIVHAKLLSVNSHPPEERVEGYIKVLYDYTRHFAIRIIKVAQGAIKSGMNEIFIRVKRIK
jgi:hypothetical protein